MKPLFSIITASFNSEKTIKRTLESVLNQSFSNFQYIIIDGKSTDNTVEIIKTFEKLFKEKEINFSWISEKDLGIYDAFNKGIFKAKGDWISFLGSDDYYLANALELYATSAKKLEAQVDLLYSNVKVEGVKIINGNWSWRKFKKKMNIAHVGAFHSEKYFKKFGLYNTDYKIAGDYELLLRAKKHLKTHKIEEITAIMSADGISNSQIKKVYLETTKAKIETGKVNFLVAKITYVIWMIKYNVKKMLHAIIR